MSPTIERIFGVKFIILLLANCIFIVVDKLASNGTSLEGSTDKMNCSFAELYRQDYRCWGLGD